MVPCRRSGSHSGCAAHAHSETKVGELSSESSSARRTGCKKEHVGALDVVVKEGLRRLRVAIRQAVGDVVDGALAREWDFAACGWVGEGEERVRVGDAACLGGALLARASGGILQERVFEEHGVAYNEVLFWRAMLGAPVFLIANVGNVAVGTTADGHAAATTSVFDEVLGSGWLLSLLVTNVVSDHITKMAISRLIGEAGSLTATLVIQLQRFASCVFSAVVLADRHPPPSLWLAIGLVAVGSLASIKRG